ncbi:hypothetical protein JJB07_14620 [Tumebacillus sp. ITR2]|uniref:DUF1641 domain-containing protein n=1 Tax=Tumebacillus amylolyticus TaxID=2801339 RepID=A0ABS1JC77_9BACL|nr:hypothetical protein [Tumebacillus amylolyticus]MBL0387872.1 hypothetical protein [Tumebacillus amylolyticus]
MSNIDTDELREIADALEEMSNNHFGASSVNATKLMQAADEIDQLQKVVDDIAVAALNLVASDRPLLELLSNQIEELRNDKKYLEMRKRHYEVCLGVAEMDVAEYKEQIKAALALLPATTSDTVLDIQIWHAVSILKQALGDEEEGDHDDHDSTSDDV